MWRKLGIASVLAGIVLVVMALMHHGDYRLIVGFFAFMLLLIGGYMNLCERAERRTND